MPASIVTGALIFFNISWNPSPSFLQRLQFEISKALPGRIVRLLSAINTHKEWQHASALSFSNSVPFRLLIVEPGLPKSFLAIVPCKKSLLRLSSSSRTVLQLQSYCSALMMWIHWLTAGKYVLNSVCCWAANKVWKVEGRCETLFHNILLLVHYRFLVIIHSRKGKGMSA